MTLRTLQRSDLDQVLAIENAVHVSPWTRETFETCIRTACKGWVVEENDKIIGFIMVSLQAQECHILNVCVAHAAQRQGLGQKLMEHAIQDAKRSGIGIAYLEVRRSNTRAISLYRKMSFQMIGERKEYYPTVSGREDALIFAKSLVLRMDDFPSP